MCVGVDLCIDYAQIFPCLTLQFSTWSTVLCRCLLFVCVRTLYPISTTKNLELLKTKCFLCQLFHIEKSFVQLLANPKINITCTVMHFRCKTGKENKCHSQFFQKHDISNYFTVYQHIIFIQMYICNINSWLFPGNLSNNSTPGNCNHSTCFQKLLILVFPKYLIRIPSQFVLMIQVTLFHKFVTSALLFIITIFMCILY